MIIKVVDASMRYKVTVELDCIPSQQPSFTPDMVEEAIAKLKDALAEVKRQSGS